jgi:recombination protein RecT
MANEISIIQRVRGELDKREADFRALLPSHIPPGQFIRTAQTAMILNEDLQSCTVKSLVIACTKAAESGISPDGEEGALVAYNVKVSKKGEPDRWEKQAKFMPMVRGIRKQVQQSGVCKDWKVRIVRAADVFEHLDGDVESITHKPSHDDDSPITHVYSIAYLDNGELSRHVMSIKAVEKVRRKSRSPDKGPWVDWYPEMVEKTCLKRHAKGLPRAKDNVAQQRFLGTLHAIDDADGLIEDRRVDEQRLSLTNGASQRMREAADAVEVEHEDVEEPDHDPETGEIIDPPAQAPQPAKRGRRSTADKIAEVEAGRVARMREAEAKKAAKEQPAEQGGDVAIKSESQEQAADDAGTDTLKSAYTWGWNDRLAQGDKAGNPRTPEFSTEAEGKHWMFGWGAMDQTIAIGNIPIDDERSQALLERALLKRYGPALS